MKYLLGLDIGTSSIKVGVFNLNGQKVALKQKSYGVSYPKSGWAEINPEIWWSKIKESISEIVKSQDINPIDICSIGISTLCPALIAVDEKYQALYPAIIFYDQRSTKEAREIKNIAPESEFIKLSGNRIIAGTSSLTSILWIKKNKPDIYKDTKFFGHGNSYIACKLTGNFYMDRTNASYMGVFNAKKTFDWEDDIIESLDLDRNKFPPVILSTRSAGTVTRKVAAETGLKEGVPVVIGGADTACSSIALGAINNGDVFESCGTSDVITVCTNTPNFNDKFHNRCHVIENKWLIHGAMSTPGATINWLKEEIGFPESKNKQNLERNDYERLSDMASHSPIGSNNLIFLPYMFGERTPIWDSNARGVLFGLSLNSKRRDIFRAIMEGVGFGLKQIIKIIEEEIKIEIDGFKVVGGGAQNKLWNQIKSDILQINITSVEYQETAVLGAAILGGIHVKEISDINRFTSNIDLGEKVTYTPTQKHRDKYEELYKIYTSLYPLLKDQFKELSLI